jgi:hypothetical protein
MLDDMRMRKLEPKTQAGYLRAVRRLAVFLKGSPDTATIEDLRRFQLDMVDRGTSPITLNATITGLKFRSPAIRCWPFPALSLQSEAVLAGADHPHGFHCAPRARSIL